MAAVTIRSFSDRDQLRRRCTDVITSTCVFVIGVVLGLLLGLATMTYLRKAVLTGCMRIICRSRNLNRHQRWSYEVGSLVMSIA